MPNAEQLLYQTEKTSHRRFSIKTLSLKILQYSRENTSMKFLRIPILKNIWVRLLLNWFYAVIIWNFWITKIPVAFGAYAVYILNPHIFLWT